MGRQRSTSAQPGRGVRITRRVAVLATAGTIGALLVAAPAPAVVPATDRLYTTDADFDLGTLTDVNHDAPNGDQLQLDRTTAFFPFVNVALSGRGTAVRIDVDSGQILGEWATAPNGRFKNPSRTTVDRLGNVWVTNRDEAAGGRGSITRIGVTLGGTRVDAGGVPDALGGFLEGPFAYNTCVDRDSDGLIRTSRGAGDVLPWTNAGGLDDNGGVATAADECILNYTRTAGTNARTVAVDANNDVWVGGFGNRVHEKLSGVTGLPVPGTQFNLGCGGYGGFIDPAGTLWSATNGNGPLRYDTNTATGACLPGDRGNYGFGVDPMTGEVWHTFLTGNRVAKLAPNGALLGTFPHGKDTAQGVAVDRDGNVWVAHSILGAQMTVGHLLTDGTFVGNVTLPGGAGPTGVSVDSNGKVWVTNLQSNNAQRIDPDAGPIGGGGVPVGAVDLTVPLGGGAAPYNYSDMTGSVLGEITAPIGTWTVVQDGGVAGSLWRRVTWNTEAAGSEPPGTSITTEVRVADTLADLAAAPFGAIANAADFVLNGRYVEVRVTLRPDAAGVSPVLSDLRVQGARPTVLVYDGDTAADYNDPAVLGATLYDATSGLPVAGRVLTLSVNGIDTCVTGPTDAAGRATCTVVITQPAGAGTATAAFAGDSEYLASNDDSPFDVTLQETATLYTGPTPAAAGSLATLTGLLLEEGVLPIAGRTVQLTVGTGAGAQSCSGTTDAAGVVTCSVGALTQPLGPNPAMAAFAGDAFYEASQGTGEVLVYAVLDRGSFVVGDQSAQGDVNYWGATWWTTNALSGGLAPAAFKGFASTLSGPLDCGATWTTRTGNSPPPPDSVPEYMAVIVASSVSQAGSAISGDTPHVVVVRTHPGYSSDPGHAGFGTVVATVC